MQRIRREPGVVAAATLTLVAAAAVVISGGLVTNPNAIGHAAASGTDTELLLGGAAFAIARSRGGRAIPPVRAAPARRRIVSRAILDLMERGGAS